MSSRKRKSTSTTTTVCDSYEEHRRQKGKCRHCQQTEEEHQQQLDFSTLTVVQLKLKLKSLKLSSAGNKQELIERLNRTRMKQVCEKETQSNEQEETCGHDHQEDEHDHEHESTDGIIDFAHIIDMDKYLTEQTMRCLSSENVTSGRINRLMQKVCSRGFTHEQQTQYLTKICSILLHSIQQNLKLHKEDPNTLSICSHLLLSVGCMIEQDDDDDHKADDRFNYQPRGGADVRELYAGFVEVLYTMVDTINTHLSTDNDGENDHDDDDDDENDLTPEQKENRIIRSTYLECLELLGRVSGALLGRSVQIRMDLWKHHQDPSKLNTQDILVLKNMDKLRDMIMKLRWTERFMCHALNILDDEIITVIHVKEKWGATFKIRGIADNDQLLIFLTHILHRLYPQLSGRSSTRAPWKVPSQSIMDVVTGIGPQYHDKSFSGELMMYSWYGLKKTPKGYQVDGMDMSSRIFGEGIPADIAPCPYLPPSTSPSGLPRVILLDKASYARCINVQRTFSSMKASCEHVKTLPRKVVEKLMQNMANVREVERTEAAMENSNRTYVGVTSKIVEHAGRQRVR